MRSQQPHAANVQGEPAKKIQKRKSPKIEKLFNFLKRDMKSVIEWDKEEKDKSTPKRIMGYLWLHRGFLASRLKR